MPHLMERGFSRIWGGNESTTRIATNRRHFVGRRNGKDLLRRNHREPFAAKSKDHKNFRKSGNSATDFLADSPLPMSAYLRWRRNLQTAKPCAGPCEGLCAPPTSRVASVYLPGSETRCWGLCARLYGGAAFIQKSEVAEQTWTRGGWDGSPGLHTVLLPSVQRIF